MLGRTFLSQQLMKLSAGRPAGRRIDALRKLCADSAMRHAPEGYTLARVNPLEKLHLSGVRGGKLAAAGPARERERATET